MKSKITVNIDSELLDIVKNVPDSDLDSIIQDAISQFLGVKQVWVRSDTLDPISSTRAVPKTETPIESSKEIFIEEADTHATITRRRQPKFVLKVWDKIKEELGAEFTTDDYWDATKISGFNYKDSARHSTIPEHLKLIEEAGEIENIGEKPKRYRKLEKNKELSEPKGPELERSESKWSGDENKQ